MITHHCTIHSFTECTKGHAAWSWYTRGTSFRSLPTETVNKCRMKVWHRYKLFEKSFPNMHNTLTSIQCTSRSRPDENRQGPHMRKFRSVKHDLMLSPMHSVQAIPKGVQAEESKNLLDWVQAMHKELARFALLMLFNMFCTSPDKMMQNHHGIMPKCRF